MSFDFTFEHPGDEVYIAYTVPYTYTQLMSHIRLLKYAADQSPFEFLKVTSIGKSNAGMDIPLLKITNPEKKKVQKPTIVMIGR